MEKEIFEAATRIVEAYVGNNAVQPDAVPGIFNAVHAKLGELSGLVKPKEPAPEPAVPVKKSVTRDYIICLEDGLKFKSLKRHLKAHYDLSPEEYREKWGLPHNYPMVAPAYAAARSTLAKNMGLGRREPPKTTPKTAKKRAA